MSNSAPTRSRLQASQPAKPATLWTPPAWARLKLIDAGSARAGPASDVFALGVVLYEDLSGGALPFPGESGLEVLRRIAAGEPEPLPDDVPPRLRTLVAESRAARSGWTST